MQPAFIFANVMARVAVDDMNRAADSFGMRGTLAAIWWGPARDGVKIMQDITERNMRVWGMDDLANSFHQVSDIQRRPFDMLAGDEFAPPQKLENNNE